MIDNTSSSFLPPQALSNVVFTNNTVHDVSGTIVFRGQVSDPIASAVITGNTMNNWVDNSGGGGWIWAGLEVSGGVTSVEIAHNTITGIPAQGTTGDGHALQLWSLTPWSVDIHDNTFTTLDGLTLSGDAVGGTEDGAVIDASGATGPRITRQVCISRPAQRVLQTPIRQSSSSCPAVRSMTTIYPATRCSVFRSMISV